MMSEKRAGAITRLARIERGRRGRKAFLDGLSYAVGATVNAEQLLNLDLTDQIRSDLNVGYAQADDGQITARRASFSLIENQTALHVPGLLANLLGEEPVLLWLKQSADCGAINLVAAKVLKACEAIRAFDGDSVSMLSVDHTQGFIFDKHADDAEETFEISIWGIRWLEAADSLEFFRTERERLP